MICALIFVLALTAVPLLAVLGIRFRQRPGRHRPGRNPRVAFDLRAP
jgi:hypothetical protein